jgi:undecaprenyl-diphosphatase
MDRMRQILVFDEAVLLGLRRWQSVSVTRLMRTLTRLGDGATWTLVALALVLSGGEAQRHGLKVGLAAVLASVFAQTLKRTCRRPRPSAGIRGFVALADNPDAFSFPSGHTAAAVAVAVALVGQGLGLGPLFAGLAVLVGISRVYLGAHYPLDVAIGAAVGSAAGVLVRIFA